MDKTIYNQVKKGDEEFNRAVRRALTGGILTGGGVAALVNAFRHARLQKEDTKKTQKKTTDDDAIVLTLPRRKLAEAEGVDELLVAGGPEGAQSRSNTSGRFGPRLRKTDAPVSDEGVGNKSVLKTGMDNVFRKEAQEKKKDWQTLYAAYIALGGGLGAGYIGVNKAYDAYRDRQLRKRLDEAKKEYLDLLQGDVKGAAAFDYIYGGPDKVAGLEKQGFGALSHGIALFLAALTAGGVGVSYLTKRVLDDKKKEREDDGYTPPPVNRIVFQTEPAGSTEKRATAEDLECVKAGLAVMLDRVGATTRFVGDPLVKSAMAEGETPEDLIKLAAHWDVLMSHLSQSPDLRKALADTANQYLTKSPFMRGLKSFGMNIPGVGQWLADRGLYAGLKKFVPKGTALPDFSTWRGGGFNFKQGSVASTLGGLAGLDVIMGSNKVDHKKLAKEILAAQRKAEARTAKQNASRKPMKIEGRDPEAAQYLRDNEDAIREVVRRLSAEGKL